MSTPSNDNPAPLFKSVEWVSPDDQVDTGSYRTMSTIRDLAAGVAVALRLVECSTMQVDNGDAPIIDGTDAARLTRMAIAAMDWVKGTIDEHFDEMHGRAGNSSKQKGTAS